MTTAVTQDQREARAIILEEYFAYAIHTMIIDEDARGLFASVLSEARDGSRYQVRCQEHGNGTVTATDCECKHRRIRKDYCKHMDALDRFYQRIYRSVTKRAVCETFAHEESPYAEAVVCTSVAPEKREQAPHKEPAFPSRKALITKLEAMNPAQVLFPAWKRDSNHRGYAVEQALKEFFGDVSFGQATHCVGLGSLKKNPKWFVQLYVDLAYDNKDITPGYILYFLNWKPAKKSKQPKQSAPTLTERMESAPMGGNRGFSLMRLG